MHAEDDRRLAVVAGIAALECRGITHGGHLVQQNGPPLRPTHGQSLQVFRPGGASQMPNQVLTPIEVNEPATGIAGIALQSRFHLSQRHAKLRHACRVGLDAQLSHLATNRNHLRNARNRQ